MRRAFTAVTALLAVSVSIGFIEKTAANEATPVLTAAAVDSTRPDTTRVFTMPEVTVTGDRWVPEMNVLPLATTVIDRNAIESSGALSAGDILRPLVGVRVASLGGLGSFSPLSIRGSSNDQVVILVDGRRLNTAQGGGADVTDIPLDDVDRIEVARGGASALYGPDAIGGAVNLVTRTAEAGRSFRLRGEAGSFGTRLAAGGLGAGSDRVAFRLNGRLLDSRGDYPFRDDSGDEIRQENGKLESRSGDASLSWKSATGPIAGLHISHYHAVKGIPGATEFPSPGAVQTDERSALDVEFPALPATGIPILGGPKAFTRVALFLNRQIRNYVDPEYPLGAIDDAHRNDAVGLSVEQKRETGRFGTFIGGAEARQDHLTSSTDGNRMRAARAVYWRQIIETSGPSGDRAARWTVVPALRYDDVGDFSGSWSPRLLAQFQAAPALELRSSCGRAFRPPSFDDLFFPARATAAGNPDLRPEHSFDVDMGLTWKHEGWTAGITGFTSRVTDLIQWQPGADGAWRPHNVDGARLSGVETEVEGSLSIPGVSPEAWIEANYTFLDPRETGDAPNTGGKVLVYRARHRANLDIRIPNGRWTAETQWRYTGPVFTTRANTKTLPGSLVGDLALFRRLTTAWTAEVRCLNVTDRLVQDIVDYPVPGRQWRFALVFRSGAS